MSKCKNCKEEHENENVGCRNSGNWNSGYWNSGDSNSGDRNSGYFNTNSPDKVRIFNTWIEMTHEEFNQKYNIFADIPLNRWIEKDDMGDEEKKKIKGWEQMGGYLKTLDFKEACKIWWEENPERHKDFLNLPNFNADIFKEITGIETTKSLSGKIVKVIVDGKEYEATIN